MKLLTLTLALVGVVPSVLGQLIELGAPSDGDVLYAGHNFTAQVIKPASPQSCIQVGIALSIAHCDEGDCPTPDEALGYVLYAGPWNPTLSSQDGPYQNFTLSLPDSMPTGPAVFTLTHLCLLGGGPIPLLEYRNASVIVDK